MTDLQKALAAMQQYGFFGLSPAEKDLIDSLDW